MDLELLGKSVLGAIGVVAALRVLLKNLAGDWGEFSRRRLKHAQSLLEASAPNSPVSAIARGACDEEPFRQLTGRALPPRLISLVNRLYATGAFSLLTLRHGVRHLPSDATEFDDKRSIFSACVDMVLGGIQTFMGGLLMFFGWSALPHAATLQHQLIFLGALVGGALVSAVHLRMAIFGKLSVDASRRLAAAARSLEQAAPAPLLAVAANDANGAAEASIRMVDAEAQRTSHGSDAT